VRDPSNLSTVLFLFIVGAVAIAMITGYTRASDQHRAKRASVAAMAVGIWMAASFIFTAVVNVPEERAFIVVAPFIGLNLILITAITLSPIGRSLSALPAAALVGFHVFRIPLEYVLHLWSTEGVIPTALSWHGQNYDVLTGLLAILTLLTMRRFRWMLVVFQLVGIAMLFNIIRIVAQNTPGSPLYTQSEEPALLLALHFPTVWIVSVCVFGAILGHAVLLRQMLASEQPVQTL